MVSKCPNVRWTGKTMLSLWQHETHSEDVNEEQEAQESDGTVGRDAKHRVSEARSHEATQGSILLSGREIAEVFTELDAVIV